MVTKSFPVLQEVFEAHYHAIMRSHRVTARTNGCMMGKKGKVRLTWPDRVKQPRMPVRKTKHTPYDTEIFGTQITSDELYARVCMRKAY